MKRGCLVAGLVLLVVGILAAGTLYGVHRRYYGNIAFNGTVWRSLADKGGKDNPRQRMVKDLRMRYLKPGMTRQEVRHLLGRSDCDSLSKDTDSYFLGVQGLAVDASTLDVRYDSAMRVVSTRVVEH